MSEYKMYLYAFSLLQGMTHERFQSITQDFQCNLEAAWHHPTDWNCKNPTIREKLLFQQKTIQPEQAYAQLCKKNISIIGQKSPLFPYPLKQCPSPPFVLFYKGKLPTFEQPLLTVVGSRNITPYGKQAMDTLLPPLLSASVGIVSGLAYGVDAYAHTIALQYQEYTIAILPSGLDQIIPNNHYNLSQRILEQGGCLLSEMPPGTPIHKGAFPRRNRLLAALGAITLVVEAAQKSGSKITAYQALENGKDVACVPGSIFSQQSQGCHDLLKQGATPVTSSNDLFALLNLQPKTSTSNTPKTKEEHLIAEMLKTKSREEVIEQSPYPAQQTLQILTSLEML